LPPDHVTCVIVRSSPEPWVTSSRFHPGESSNPKIERPSGAVSSTVVVVVPSSSVGTISVNSCVVFVFTTPGLIPAWA